MRIGMDVSLLLYPEVVGMRVHLEQLLAALLRVGTGHDFVLFHHSRRAWHGTAAVERWAAPNVEIVAAPLPVRSLPDAVWWFGWHPPLERLLATRVDVFHAGDFMWPRSTRTPMVATLHDLTPEVFPELHVWPNRVRHRRQMCWLRGQARRIIAISRSSANDFERLFSGGPPIDVVHPGPGLDVHAAPAADTGSLRARLQLGDAPYMLCVGTVEPRKNGERLVHAFTHAFRDAADAPHLVFAGVRGWHSDAVYGAAAASPLHERIHFTGRVSPAELAALYRGATALLYPSLYEGFGLPVLEAMQAGVPVLTSNVSSLPEVAGDGALLVDPRNVGAIAEAIARLHDDPALRSSLIRRGHVRAAQFSWDRAARETLHCYALACDMGPR